MHAPERCMHDLWQTLFGLPTNLIDEGNSRLLFFGQTYDRTKRSSIVVRNLLATLVLLLQSEDTGIHYEAVGVIGNLVHSSPKIKMDVLHAGALQPVIKLFSSTCSESQREAALLLGQFAAADTDSKLSTMCHNNRDKCLQDTHNQAGIAHSGGIVPLLNLLESKNGTLQHIAVFYNHLFLSISDPYITLNYPTRDVTIVMLDCKSRY
ncbi:ARM REPEAT PROTEIN INTERACTING WITH ABF2 [Artemisia annua]|uniref:ARM REPEAT PROTEIN INTERACTING WITH ABF2 n=1 Tax=Artemisia annua TaxID=35608 RepID=A0A2U1MWR3_ARTAN|nr:ARM REPEAT PROTEIN INTERACTING WITH ABF2 [Artemisia annua]